MKYDIYKGSLKDMGESGGELFLTKCNKVNIAKFCNRQKISFDKFFNDGEYISVGDYGFWVEEA